ncbi:hypothetical protein J7M23_12715 [Candidatus Sumerlaeota bacterium]|nr:hypothetical protein [Candidatus Sumerlaeota bacterium]
MSTVSLKHNATQMKPIQKNGILLEGLTLFLGILFLAIFITNCLAYWKYINDDAYITFRYSRNLIEGRGPVYNVGEHVEGYTNFLWMILSAVLLVFINKDTIGIWTKLIGLITSLGSIWLIYLLSLKLLNYARKRGDTARPIALSFLGVLFLAMSPDLGCNSVNTLETSLFTFLIISGFYREMLTHLEARPARLNGLIFALAAITRPEGYLYFMLAILGRWWLKQWFWRRTLTDVILFVLVTAPVNIFRYSFYDGELLPNTYWAKLGGFCSGAEYIADFFLDNGYGILGVFLIIGLAGARMWRINAYFLLIILGVFVGILRTGGDWMPGKRLMVPVIPFIMLLMQEGVITLYSVLRKNPLLKILPFIMLFIAFIGMFRNGIGLAGKVQGDAVGYLNGHLRLAYWLKAQNLKPKDKIALMDIGLVGYVLTPQPILDITGLTDRYIAKSPGTFLNKYYDPAYVLNQNPAYVILVSSTKPKFTKGKVYIESHQLWSNMEQRIYEHPLFRKHYQFARFFNHYSPLSGYYLLVFKRRER